LSDTEYIKTTGVIIVPQSFIRIWSIMVWEFEVTGIGKVIRELKALL